MPDRISLLKKDLSRLIKDYITRVRPKAIVNKQIVSVKAELARLGVDDKWLAN